MTSTMASPISPARSDWDLGHVPRLSYRNPLPQGETLPERRTDAEVPMTTRPAGRGLSIKEIREALPREVVAQSNQLTIPCAAMQAQKPKKSFLGGLFTKEPSMAALDQVAQQMMAQHGSISPKSVPHVSSQKMPEYVPKVNARWDGVPDYVKKREKEERDKAKWGHRNSIHPIDTTSRSTGLTDDQSAIRRRNSNAASTAESWDSRSSGSRPVFQDNYSIRPESVYSTSSNTSLQGVQRSPSTFTTPYPTFITTANAPDISQWIDATPIPPKGPQRMQSAQSTSTRSTCSSDQSRVDRSPRRTVPSANAIPECTSSAATTPIERSPQTPAHVYDDDGTLNTSIPNVPALPAAVPSVRSERRQELNRSGTTKSSGPRKSSRTGLGLQTGNVVAPWETQTLPSEAAKTNQTEPPAKTRVKGRLFGKEKK